MAGSVLQTLFILSLSSALLSAYKETEWKTKLKNSVNYYCKQMEPLSWKACGTTPTMNLDYLPPGVAGFGEFPWQAAVIDTNEEMFICGATLVSPRHVLTTASCVKDKPSSELTVRLGEWDILSNDHPAEVFSNVELPVSKKYIHPEYNTSSCDDSEGYNLALLKLKYPVSFENHPHVLPACLAPSTFLNYTDCWVAGWNQSPLLNIQMSPLDGKQKCKKPKSEEKKHESAKNKNTEDEKSKKGNSKTCAVISKILDELDKSFPNPCLKQEKERYVSAWHGRASGIEPKISSRLLSKARVEVLECEDCSSRMSKVYLELEPEQVCAFGKASSPCVADIGSSVVCSVSHMNYKGGQKMAVAALITHTYRCSDEESTKPILALNLEKGFDFICRTIE